MAEDKEKKKESETPINDLFCDIVDAVKSYADMSMDNLRRLCAQADEPERTLSHYNGWSRGALIAHLLTNYDDYDIQTDGLDEVLNSVQEQLRLYKAEEKGK